MKQYIVRAAKYVVYLAILFLLIFAFMNAVGSVKTPFSVIITTSRGMWLWVVILVFAFMYPFFGFTKKSLTVNAEQKDEEIDRVMLLCGYMRTHGAEEQGVMEFRADRSFKRLMLMYEDRIVIRTQGGFSVMEGPRKEVVKAAFRISTFVQ